MNPDIANLLRQMLGMMPSFQNALTQFARAIPGVAAAVDGLINAIARTGVVQAALNTGLGRVVAAVAGAALGGLARAGGAVAAGVGAMASSPFGQVVAAAGVAALAITALGLATEKLGRTFLESQRHLADSSAAMAMVFAQSDLRRTMREMRAGADQATTAGFLARSLDSLADTLQPILSLLANITNVVLGVLADIVNVIVAPVSAMARGIMDIFAWLKKRWPFGGDDTGEPKTLSQWLDDLSSQTRQERNLPWTPRGRFVPA